MTRTRLYLDVDGVINAKMPMGWGRLQNGRARFESWDFHIRWAPNMVTALTELDLDLVWATTWRDDAPKHIAPLIGYGRYARVLHPRNDRYALTTYPSIEWKLLALTKDLERHPGPFVWIDDEITPAMVKWAESVGGLAIQTRSDLGIRPADIERIKSYIASLEGALV